MPSGICTLHPHTGHVTISGMAPAACPNAIGTDLYYQPVCVGSRHSMTFPVGRSLPLVPARTSDEFTASSVRRKGVFVGRGGKLWAGCSFLAGQPLEEGTRGQGDKGRLHRVKGIIKACGLSPCPLVPLSNFSERAIIAPKPASKHASPFGPNPAPAPRGTAGSPVPNLVAPGSCAGLRPARCPCP